MPELPISKQAGVREHAKQVAALYGSALLCVLEAWEAKVSRAGHLGGGVQGQFRGGARARCLPARARQAARGAELRTGAALGP